eukprot:scaffold49931_cov86-Phaeocystis_antarctica.AAC.2
MSCVHACAAACESAPHSGVGVITVHGLRMRMQRVQCACSGRGHTDEARGLLTSGWHGSPHVASLHAHAHAHDLGCDMCGALEQGSEVRDGEVWRGFPLQG